MRRRGLGHVGLILWLSLGLSSGFSGGCQRAGMRAPRETHRIPKSGPAPKADEPESAVTTKPAADGTPAPEAAPSRPSLLPVRSGELLPLAVPGFLPAVVVAPNTAPKPLIVAAHGAGGSPEAHCQLWRGIVQNRAFVLCPRGREISQIEGPSGGHYYPDHHSLEREVLASVKAFQARFETAAYASGAIYVGYSQGATMGALMLPKHGGLFQRLILIEGGASEWNLSAARRFLESGGQRVLFVCGVSACARQAKQSAAWLEKIGVDARVEHAAGAGHTYGGRVRDKLVQAFDWVIAGESHWEASLSSKP